MNPDARKTAYEMFSKDGYNGSQEEFIELISTNSDAFSLSYRLFAGEGYEDGPEAFQALMGIGGDIDTDVEEVEPPEFVPITAENIAEDFQVQIDLYDDEKYKPELVGEERAKEKAELEAEKERRVQEAIDNPNILEEANIIEKFRFENLNASQEEKDKAAAAAKAETTEQGFFDTFKEDMASGKYREENPEMLERVEEDLKSGMWWNIGEIWKATTDDDYAKNKGKKLAKEEYKIATDKWANQTTKDLINAASRLEYTEEELNALTKSLIQDNKSTLVRGGSRGTDGNPRPADFATANNLPTELVDEAMKIAGDRRAAQNLFKANKKELDKLLTDFEDREGVTAVMGHISGLMQSVTGVDAFGPTKDLLEIPEAREILKAQDKLWIENFIPSTDQEYQKNRETLNSIIHSRQKGTNYKINANVYMAESAKDRMDINRDKLLELEARAQNGYPLSEAELVEYRTLKDGYNSDVDIAQQAMIDLGQLTVVSNNFDEIRDETLKTYSTLSVYGNNIGSSTVRLVAGLGTLAHELTIPQMLKWQGMDLENEAFRSELASQIDGFLGTNAGDIIESGLEAMLITDKAVEQAVGDLHEYHAEIKAENRDKMQFGDIENAADFFSWGFEGISENAVNLAASAVIPGGGGLILMAAAESGNKMHEMNKEMEGVMWTEEELLANAAEKERLGDAYDFFYQDIDEVYKTQPKDISALAYFSTAGIYGAAEYVSEKITLGNFKFAKNNIQKALKLGKVKPDAGKFIDMDFIPKTRLTKLKNWGLKTGGGTFQEAFGEGGVQIANNLADILLLDNKDISVLDGVGEAMVMGAFMNGTMASPMILSHAAAFARPEATNVLLGQNGKRIFDLAKKRDLLTAQMQSLKDTNPSLQEKLAGEKNQIEQEINELATKQLEIMHETDETITSLIPQDRQTLIDVFNEEHSLKRKMDKVNNSTELTKQEKGNQLNDLNKQLVVQNAIKQHTLSNRVFNADKQKAKNFATAWRVKKGTLNEVKTITGIDNSELETNAIDYVKGLDNLTAEEQNQVVDQIRNEFQHAKAASKGNSTMHGFAFGDNITIETQDGKKNIDIPINFAMNSGNRTVQSHEMGHQTVFKEFIANNPQAVGLVQDLEGYVKRNYGNAFNEYLKETGFSQVYETKDSKGKLKNPALVAEEKLAALSDFMRKKNLKGMRTLHNKLFGRFNKFNDGSSQQIRTGKDVFDMLMSYNQSFKTGTLEGLTKGLAEGTVEISRKKKSKIQDKGLGDRKVGSPKSMTQSEKQQIEDSFNEFPGVKGPDGTYTMTKAEWQADKGGVLSKAITLAMDGALDGLIIEQMALGEDIHGLSRQEFMRRVYTKLGMHIYNFDPTVSKSLFGWVNTYLGKRVGDVANEAKRQKAKQPKKTVSTDQSIGEQGRTVAETIEGDDAASIEAAVDASLIAESKAEVIDNLRTRLGIEKNSELYNTVVAAVEKTFGRTKLKDVSNIEFKQDLKNKFNTEIFKAVKNYLGTRKKYEEFITGEVAFKTKDGKTKTMPRWEMLMDYFSQSVVNKRFEQFKEPLIDPATGKQARPDNNPLFRKRDDITKEEWKNYFLGKDVKTSTKGTRKDALASAIAEELAFDATMEVIEDPAVQNKIKEFYELQGLRQAENFVEKVGKTIDRIPGSKFSITKDSPLQQFETINAVQNLNQYLNEQEDNIRKGVDLAEIIDDYLSKQEPAVKTALNKYVSELKSIAKKYKGSEINLETFKKLREGDPEAVLSFYGSMDKFYKDKNLNVQMPDLKTEIGEQQFLDFFTDITSIIDPKMVESGMFISTFGAGNVEMFSSGTRINSQGKEVPATITAQQLRALTDKSGPKDYKGDKTSGISANQYKKIDGLMKSYTTQQRNDPKIQKEIAEKINKILGPKKIKAIQETRDYFYKKLNEYIQSKPEGVARDKAIANVARLLQLQSSLTSGIPRQGAVPTTISTVFSETAKKSRGEDIKMYHKEHNLPSVVFNTNVLASIIDGTFDQVYPQISQTYSQSILDTDIQLAQDYGLVSKEFYDKYPSAQLINTGRTAEMKGYEMGMPSEAIFVVATGNAPFQLDLATGLTLDKVIYNKLGAQDVFSHIGKVADMINNDLKKSPLGNVIIDKNNQQAIFSSKENIDLFNQIITNSVNDQNIDTQTIELGIKLKNKKSYDQRDNANNDIMNDSGVVKKFSKTINTTQEVLDEATIMDKALNIARDPNAPIKKIRVFDFDDTLARTKSNVLYTMPDGTTGKLSAEQFAQDGDSILEQGGKFDFSEFNQVKDGKPGPLLEIAKKIQKARGTEDVFVLTARAQAAGPAIKQFLNSLGLNIPLKNITGLGNSSPLAKSNWIVNKAAEGYNDFYFADDHTGNVAAVKKALDVIDVKSSVQQAKVKFSRTVDQTVNDILEHKFGIKSEKEYSDVKARLKGRKKGRFKFFLPPSAEDFVGLLYSMLGRGEIGDMQMEFFKEHLLEPYGRAMENLSRDQNRMINDFKALKAQLVKEGLIPKNLNKKAFAEFTHQDVARILAWHKQGMDIPGLSKTDLNQILKFAQDNPAIDVFAQNLIDINKGDGYSKPGPDWLAGTISTDLLDGLRTGKRGKYLEQWQQNVDLIFSPKNLNKMEAAMGSKWREAMENMLTRMRTGKNRTSTAGRLENRLLDYVNNSVGTVMFFNMRSAILQTISAVNFINWSDNNILKAAQAFANQPQYWKDFMELMNSEFLVERRNGLKLNVSESEIADAAATSKNKAKAVISYLLKKGFLPTQIADSFAIASGGATFYRNKIKSLMKKGMSEADAKAQAFLEFREIAEESQQSSRPDRISQQQASGLGRVILAFANTPMQYNRLIKKAGLDLFNRRKISGQTQLQSDFSNISKITYYVAVQNLIFNALQQALYALAFDDEEEDAKKQKYYNTANGMLDSILRGSGIAGVGASTLLSMIRKVYKEAQKEGTFPGPEYADAAWELLNFSPPIDIKASKLRIAGNNWKYEGWKHDEAQWGIDDPAYKSAAYVISALTNIPVDRLFKKMDNIQGALDSQEETWKRISQALGWTKWQLETQEDIKQHRAQEKPKKKQALKNMYGETNPEVYSKTEQEEILKKHGYTKEQIKAMKREEDRVKAILDKQKETGKVVKPTQARAYKPKKLITLKQIEKEKEEEKKQKEIKKYKSLNKPRQVEMLDSLGMTKTEIRKLKYEDDRVAKLIELMSK